MNSNTHLNIIDYRDYNIENNKYYLKIELDKQYIYFNLTKLNQSLEYIYKKTMKLEDIFKEFDLNPLKHSNSELEIFDKLYENNSISINMNGDTSCVLIFKLYNRENIELKLSQFFMNDNDKYNILYNEFNLIKKEISEIKYKTEIEEMKKTINELNNNFNKKEENINDISRQNNNIIEKINEIISIKENKIKGDNIDKITNKRINEIEKIIINDIKDNIKNEINNIINIKLKEIKSEIEIKENKYKDPAKNIEKNTEDILKINNKFKDIEKYKEENNIEINTKEIIKNENITKEKEKDDEININKIKELNDKYEELKRNIKNNLYTNKINYKFKKEPQSLKFKLNITETNNSSGWNDIFEIFISHKDNKEYLVSPNTYTKNLDIFRLSDNKIIKNLEGHESDISTIRYFINKNSYNFDEYLITADKDKKIIIWDITDTILNYKIKYKIDTKYENTIYSCLLIFPHNNDDDNFIITSTKHKSNDNEKSSTKIYSLNNGDLIKYINNSKSEYIYYLLSWYNKKNNKYYIIQFSYKKIIINNLIEDELYSKLKQ